MKRFFLVKKALYFQQKSETTLGVSKLTTKKALFWVQI